jgi:hypothetical protein
MVLPKWVLVVGGVVVWLAFFPRTVEADDGPRGRSILRRLLGPPPSVLYGVETPASRMARHAELGGGAGPVPGFTNGPSYAPLYLPGAGSDPALSPRARSRVLRRAEVPHPSPYGRFPNQ